MSKLSICHASLLESYLSVKLAICQSYLFVMLATCHSYMSKQLAHLVPVLRKFLVKLLFSGFCVHLALPALFVWHALARTCCLSFWDTVCMSMLHALVVQFGHIYACTCLHVACILHVSRRANTTLRMQAACKLRAVLFCACCVHFGMQFCLDLFACIA